MDGTNWSLLLRKFVNNEIDDVERFELYRQMGTNIHKLEQFDQVTESDYYRNSLRYLFRSPEEDQADLERFMAKLDAHIRNKGNNKG